MKKDAINAIDNIVMNFSYGYTYPKMLNGLEFDFIRDEPKFKEILAKAKKVHEERVAKYGHYFDEE